MSFLTRDMYRIRAVDDSPAGVPGWQVARVRACVQLRSHAPHHTRSLFRNRARRDHRPSALRAGRGRANRRADVDHELPDDRGPPHRTGAHLGAARASEAMKTPRALLTPPVGPRDHVLGPADARVTP